MEHEIAGLDWNLQWTFHPLAFNQEVNETVYLALTLSRRNK